MKWFRRTIRRMAGLSKARSCSGWGTSMKHYALIAAAGLALTACSEPAEDTATRDSAMDHGGMDLAAPAETADSSSSDKDDIVMCGYIQKKGDKGLIKSYKNFIIFVFFNSVFGQNSPPNRTLRQDLSVARNASKWSRGNDINCEECREIVA